MKIYGIRFYPKTVKKLEGQGSPIFIHKRISEEHSDFFYIFRPLALTPVWHGQLFADSFVVGYNENGREDRIPALRERFGSSLVDADNDRGLLLLRGNDFMKWAPQLHFCEGAVLNIFRKPPAFRFLDRIRWGRTFRLTATTWPRQMTGLIQMWDDIFWQFFTPDYSEIEILIRVHTGDPKLKMYFVDLETQYPNPRKEELREATLSEP